MRTRLSLGGVQFTASAPAQIYLRSLPTVAAGQGRVARLTSLEFEWNISVAASGLVTSQQLHDLATYYMDDGSEPWGPVNLPGHQLSQLLFKETGAAIPFADSTTGDTPVNNTTATRIFREFYSFEAKGNKESLLSPFNYCPPCSALRGGSIQFDFSALPANATGITGTLTVYAHIFWAPDMTASQAGVIIPRVKSVRQAITGTGMDLTFDGLVLSMFADSAPTAVALTDFQSLSLFADGFPIINDTTSPLGRRGINYNQNPSVSSSLLQQTFCDTTGGTNPFAMFLYPVEPNGNSEHNVAAETFLLNFTGAGSAAEAYTMLTTFAVKVTDAAGNQQVGGAPDGHVLIPVSAGTTPLAPGSTALGYTPVVVAAPGSVLARAHATIQGTPASLASAGLAQAVGSGAPQANTAVKTPGNAVGRGRRK